MRSILRSGNRATQCPTHTSCRTELSNTTLIVKNSVSLGVSPVGLWLSCIFLSCIRLLCDRGFGALSNIYDFRANYGVIVALTSRLPPPMICEPLNLCRGDWRLWTPFWTALETCILYIGLIIHSIPHCQPLVFSKMRDGFLAIGQ